MANIILQSGVCHKVVFSHMTYEQAVTIAHHMNKLTQFAAKQSGKAITTFFRVIGK